MERIMIIGCGGSGKSTLARALGEKTGLPVVHLDQIWWSPGNWQHLEREEFDRRLLEELEDKMARSPQKRLEQLIDIDEEQVAAVLKRWLMREEAA